MAGLILNSGPPSALQQNGLLVAADAEISERSSTVHSGRRTLYQEAETNKDWSTKKKAKRLQQMSTELAFKHKVQKYQDVMPEKISNANHPPYVEDER